MAIDVKELQTAIENKDETEEYKPIQDLITSLVTTAVTDVETKLVNKNKEILDEKKKLQQEIEKLPSTEEFKELKEFKEKLASNKEAQLIADGKIEEVFSRRTEAMRLDNERKLKLADEELIKAQKNNENLNAQFVDYKIKDAITKAAINEKVIFKAIPDVISRSTNLFSLDEKTGEILARDEDNQPLTFEGENMTPEIYLKSIKESASHLWPQSKSGFLTEDIKADDESLIKSANNNVEAFIAHRRKHSSNRK